MPLDTKKKNKRKIKKKGKGFFSVKSKLPVVELKIKPVNISDIEISSQTQKREAAANEKKQKREAAANERRKIREAAAIERAHRKSVIKYKIEETRDISRDDRESQTIERQGDSLDRVIKNYERKFNLYKKNKNLPELTQLLDKCKNLPKIFTDTDEFVVLANNIQICINDLNKQNAGKNKKKTLKKKKR